MPSQDEVIDEVVQALLYAAATSVVSRPNDSANDRMSSPLRICASRNGPA